MCRRITEGSFCLLKCTVCYLWCAFLFKCAEMCTKQNIARKAQQWQYPVCNVLPWQIGAWGTALFWWLSSVLSSVYTPVLSSELSVHTNHLDPRRSRCWRRTLLCWEKTYFSLAFTKRVHLLGKKHLCTKSGDLANTPNLFTHPQSWYNVHPPTVMLHHGTMFTHQQSWYNVHPHSWYTLL